MNIIAGGLDHPDVIAMLDFHSRTNYAVTPPASVHVLDLEALKAPSIQFYSAWDGKTLLGVGALKALTPEHGEIKSMHTNQQLRRRGIGSAMLAHLIDQARRTGFKRLSLETGSFAFFEPAVALYTKHGFTACAPFADYEPDPFSTFLTRQI